MIQVREAELDSMLERASENGANRVLEKLGLQNGEAARDIQEIRSLAQSLRAARSTVWQTVVRLATIALLAALIGGAAIKTKLFG